MRAAQLRRTSGSCTLSATTRSTLPATCTISRRPATIVANWNPFGQKGGDADAARRAIEQSFSKKLGPDAAKKAAKPAEPAKPASPAAPKNPLQGLFGGGGGSPPGGGGGGGGDGGGGGFFSGGGAEPGGEEPMHKEFFTLMRGTWVLLSNLAVFLVFSSFLHRSLDWFVQTELLVAVGAPQQAGERVVGKLFEAVEWFERNVLGWTLPGDLEAADATSKVYEVLQNYTPPEAAYTFAQLKYGKQLSYADQQLLHKAYALRSFERADGQPGEVDPAELQAVKDRLDPMEADRRAFQRAKAQGRLDEYWAAPGREETYRRIVGAQRAA